MGFFYVTAAALPDLALLLLTALIVGYLALRPEKAPGTGWLIALMVGQAAFHAVNLVAAGAHTGWAVHLNALILVCPLVLLWAMLGFAYRFLSDPYPRESRWVLAATGLLAGAQVVGHAAWGLMAPGPLLEPLRQALLVTAPFLLLVVLWTVGVMVRRVFRRDAGAAESRAFRALLLIELCSVVALAALVLRDAGVLGPFVWRQVTLLVTTVFLLGFVTVYANYVPTPTTFQVKVVGFTLAVLLAALGMGAVLAHDGPAWAGAPPPQAVRFDPDGAGRYRLTREAAPLDTGAGARLGMQDGLGVRVPLGFAFPFAGRSWDAVFVDDDGFVSFGSTFQLTSLAAPLGMRTPWIGPLVTDLDPHDGGIYLRREPGRAVVTWRALPLYGRPERATAQLVLAADGSIAFRYGEVPPNAAYMRGLHPGPATPIAPAAFEAMPQTVEAAAGRVEDGYTPALRAEHRRATPLAALMLTFTLLVLVAFPLYLRVGITRPLGRLLDGVRRVNAGDLTADVPVGVHDEIGQLTDDFNTMTGSLRRYATELERLVAERTAALEEKSAALEQSLDELHQMQAELVQQEKLAGLGRLTAGIAHEIKNPLNFITNFASLSTELVRELREELDAARGGSVEDVLPTLDPLLDDLATNTDKVQAHGQRADAIVQGMMAHARGGQEPRQPVDLNPLVAEHVGLAVEGWAEKNPSGAAAVSQIYDLETGVVMGMPQALGRVVINLVTNALDALAERAAGNVPADYAPTVTVSTHRRDGHVEITVADNGVGLSEAAQRRLFEPFFTTKPTGRGNIGLGLSLSRDVVHAQGGTLEATSREGEGTTFTARLPAEEG